MRYRSCRADDGDLRSRLSELAQQRRRFGYRRLHILLRRDGITINRNKTQRLYREEYKDDTAKPVWSMAITFEASVITALSLVCRPCLPRDRSPS